MKTSTALYALYARDSIIRIANTPAHRGSVESAARELSVMPCWQRRPGALRAGLTEARRLVASHLGVKAAEAAINA